VVPRRQHPGQAARRAVPLRRGGRLPAGVPGRARPRFRGSAFPA